MLCASSLKKALPVLALLASFSFGGESWRLAAGASAGRQTPIMATLGLGYKNAILYVEGMGAHKGDNDFWCGWRGDLAWTLFRDLPFKLDLGVSGGYEYARAPNKMHQALNKANGGTYVYPFNYKESLDISLEIRAHLYGFYSQIAYPLNHFIKHDEPAYTWRIGYMVDFL